MYANKVLYIITRLSQPCWHTDFILNVHQIQHLREVKAKRNKGMKNAGHGLNPGRRYWCHASDSLTEPSGPGKVNEV